MVLHFRKHHLVVEFLQQWPFLLALSVTGIFAGTLAGLLGVGGGIVLVPVLFFLFQKLGISPGTSMSVATGTSLATIIPTSLSSIRSQNARQNIDWQLVKHWLPFMILGVVTGAFLVTSIKGSLLSGFFGILAFIVALNMLLRASAPALKDRLPGMSAQRALSYIVGSLSVMAGIGGGTLGVPILSLFDVKAHRAIGNAAVFGFIIALPGTLVMWLGTDAPVDAPTGTYGLINIPGMLAIIPMTIVFAPVGVALGHKTDAVLLKKIFAVFLLLTGGRMISQLFGV